MKGNDFLLGDKNKKIMDQSLLEKYIFLSLKCKYYIDQFTYGTIIINNIIYNEKSNIVEFILIILFYKKLNIFIKIFIKNKK